MKRWFDLHISNAMGIVGMSLGDHVVRRKTSKSARNSTVICLEVPAGFEGNVMTLLVKWSDSQSFLQLGSSRSLRFIKNTV